MSNEIVREAEFDNRSFNPLEVIDVEKAVARVQAISNVLDKCVKVSIQRTSPADWVRMKSSKGESFYLQATGAQKVRAVWGIYFFDREVTKETDGQSYAFIVSGKVGSKVLDQLYGKVVIDVEGGRSSSDTFFTGRDGNKTPDILDVRKAAIANWEARAICSLLGLKNFTAEDLTRNGINPASVPSFSFQGGSEGGGQGGQLISDAQQKRLFAITAKSGMNHDAVKAHLKKKYGIDSSSQIPRDKYEEICKWVESGGAAASDKEIQVS